MDTALRFFESSEHTALYESLPSTHVIVDEGTSEGQTIWFTAEWRVDIILNQFVWSVVVLILRHRSLHDIDWSTVDTSRLIIRDLWAWYDSVYKKHSQWSYPFPNVSLSLCSDSWAQWQQYQRTPSTYLWLPHTDPVPHHTMHRLDDFHRTTQAPTDQPLITIMCPPSLVSHFFPLIEWGKEWWIGIALISSSILMPTILSEATIGALYASGRIWLCCDWMYATERLQHREELISWLGFSCSSIAPQRDAVRSFDFWDAYQEIYSHETILATITNHHSRKQALADQESDIGNER